jgi:hypothetical protein
VDGKGVAASEGGIAASGPNRFGFIGARNLGYADFSHFPNTAEVVLF